MFKFNLSAYDDWMSYYLRNNREWDSLSSQQKIILLELFKRKYNICEDQFEDCRLIKEIKKDLSLYNNKISIRSLTNIQKRLGM